MNTVYLERHDITKNMHRFYRLWVMPTLFGDWALIREWGRVGSPGTVREYWYGDREAAEAEGEKLHREKRRRGYQPR